MRTRVRRLVESLIAGLALLALSPFLAVIALAVKSGDGGAVFYAQLRVGKNFRLFRLWKFRSMVAGAEQAGSITSAHDGRTTKVGRVLRRYKIDELPQLINVVLGEMQFVGPRPEVERYVNLFRGQYERLLEDCPGITDTASLAYRNEESLLDASTVEEQYIAQLLPDKLRLSLNYHEQRTVISDCLILLQTVLPFCARSAMTELVKPDKVSVKSAPDSSPKLTRR